MQIVSAAAAIGRIAAVETRNETPAAQWRTLAVLRQYGPLRLGELAGLSRVTQPGMTRLVGTMADAGLVHRASDPDDSRVTVVSGTVAGDRALDAWTDQLGEALEPLFAELPDDDWDVLTRAAEILTARIASAEETTR